VVSHTPEGIEEIDTWPREEPREVDRQYDGTAGIETRRFRSTGTYLGLAAAPDGGLALHQVGLAPLASALHAEAGLDRTGTAGTVGGRNTQPHVGDAGTTPGKRPASLLREHDD